MTITFFADVSTPLREADHVTTETCFWPASGRARRTAPVNADIVPNSIGVVPILFGVRIAVDVARDEIWHQWREAQQEAPATGRAEAIKGRSPALGREGREGSALSQQPLFCRLEMCASSSSNSAQPWK